MPRIQTYTAQTGPGIIQANRVSPDSFGAQAAAGSSDLGKGFEQIGARVQHAQDAVDLARVTGEYETGLDAVKARVIQDPNIDNHGDLLAAQTQKLQDAILKANPDLSSAVQTTFQSHAAGLYAKTRIEVAHEGRKLQVQRAITDFSVTQDALTDRAASAPTLEDADRHLVLLDHLRSNMVRQGVISPQDALKYHEAATNRYWSLVAQKDPNRIMGMLADQAEGATHVAGMDNAKFNQYVGVAVNILHQRQATQARLDKEQEKAVKDAQDSTHARVLADAISGKNVEAELPELVRTRQIDPDKVAGIMTMQEKKRDVPSIANYQRGHAEAVETDLDKRMFDGKPLSPDVLTGILDDYNKGRILQDEFHRLNDNYNKVQAFKQQQGQAHTSDYINKWHGVLVRSLSTVGPADKYDALAGQTISAAEDMYFHKMRENPNADPEQVMHQVEQRYKPVIEKRLGLSEKDKAALNDARMQAAVDINAISPAAHRAWRDREQERQGLAIVQEAIKNLPPPPPPGFFERMRKMVTPSTERRAGVMSGE